VGGLAHYLEDEGIATVGISLIRTHTEKIRPPRALAVPFELGRPFGAPDEPDFQRRVLRDLLGLLARKSGPVLEDFPDVPPGEDEERFGYACPVNLAQPMENLSDTDLVRRALEQEIALLRPWYEEFKGRRKGRTAFGISGHAPEAIAAFLARLVVDEDKTPPPVEGLSLAVGFKRLADDIRYFYTEAAVAKPGTKTSDVELGNWMYGETMLGKVLIEIRNWMLDRDDPQMKVLATTTIVPNHQRFRTKHG